MKQEILERLLTDRALDALTPDVGALLEAYLEGEPGHQRDQEIRTAVRLAKMACPKPAAISLPPLKRAPAIAFKRILWPAELAAAFILGMGLSFWALRPSNPVASSPTRPLVRTVDKVPGPGNGSAFWSMSRLASLETKTSSAMPPRLQWRSPIRNPQAN